MKDHISVQAKKTLGKHDISQVLHNDDMYRSCKQDSNDVNEADGNIHYSLR